MQDKQQFHCGFTREKHRICALDTIILYNFSCVVTIGTWQYICVESLYYIEKEKQTYVQNHTTTGVNREAVKSILYFENTSRISENILKTSKAYLI